MEEGFIVTTALDAVSGDHYVLESYNNQGFRRTANEARARGREMLRAVGIAQGQAVMVAIQAFEGKEGKGFAPPNQKHVDRIVQSATVLAQSVEPPPPDDIGIGYAFKFDTRVVHPVIYLRWGEEHIKVLADDATRHAQTLLEVAEACQTDTFLGKFLQNDVGISLSDVQRVLGEFSQFRLQELLEEKLDLDDSEIS